MSKDQRFTSKVTFPGCGEVGLVVNHGYASRMRHWGYHPTTSFDHACLGRKKRYDLAGNYQLANAQFLTVVEAVKDGQDDAPVMMLDSNGRPHYIDSSPVRPSSGTMTILITALLFILVVQILPLQASNADELSRVIVCLSALAILVVRSRAARRTTANMKTVANAVLKKVYPNASK